MVSGRWDEDENRIDKGFVPTNNDESSEVDEDDDVPKCKYCGSTNWADLSDSESNQYWCGNCGTKFYVESKAENLKHEIEYTKLQKTKNELWGTKKRKIITIGSLIILGFVVFRFVMMFLRSFF